MSSKKKRTTNQIRQIGEFGLIELIKKQILSKDKKVLVNIGDDAAVFKTSSDKLSIFTTDTMVEKIHFDLRYCTFEEIGWKAMAANLSDIAAMGGLPTYALVTIGLPKSARIDDILSIYEGATKIARRHNCKIIGGDTTLVRRDLFISITLLGQVEKKFLVTRSGAKKGDLICITGKLGEALAGLELLKRFGRRDLSLATKHLKPEPKIDQARVLIRNLKVNSMIDISDGLSSELFHLTEESQVGALLYEQRIPVSAKCRKAALLLNGNPLRWALSSGEEYELLFTVNRRDKSKLDSIKSKLGISVVGEITDKLRGVRMVRKSGAVQELKKSGFAHF
jgi:thiamine-monophosphate kinase